MRAKLEIAIAMVALSALLGSAWGAPAVVLDMSSLLSGAITEWYGVAAAAAVLVIAVSALIYMLSSTLGLGAPALSWARTQIYEALLGLVFIAILLSFYSTMLLNPQPFMSAANLVPPTCTTANENTMFNLAACDLSTFLSMSEGMFQMLYYVTYVTSIVPEIRVAYKFPGLFNVGIGTKITLSPTGEEETLSIGFSLLLFMIMVNELQMILIAAAPLMLSMLMAIGVIAWILGFSRRFGGAMISLALAFGIIYPLLVSLTYGYTDTAIIQAFNFLNPSGQITFLTKLSSLAVTATWAGMSFLNAVFSTFLGGGSAGMASLVGYYLLNFGYIFAGLSFIPFLNFMILESFVLDLSKVLGERVSFMAMINTLV